MSKNVNRRHLENTELQEKEKTKMLKNKEKKKIVSKKRRILAYFDE